MRILVIDDDKDLCEMITTSLALDFEPEYEISHDKENAIEKINSWHPDIVICDLKMPGNNGTEILKFVREQKGHNIRFAFLTGATDGDFGDWDKVVGADKFFEKPLNFQKLERWISFPDEEQTA